MYFKFLASVLLLSLVSFAESKTKKVSLLVYLQYMLFVFKHTLWIIILKVVKLFSIKRQVEILEV